MTQAHALHTNGIADAHAAQPAAYPNRRSVTLSLAAGPLVVDIWEPLLPAADVTPILLIHGWGGSGSYWESTAAALAATARVIVPDLPGTGRSQPVKRPQSLFDQVATIGDLLDALDLPRVQVVGHSMGGAMALLLADARPEQVERLVLTSLCFFLTEAQQRIYGAIMRGFAVFMTFRPAWLSSVPGVARMLGRRYFYRLPQDRRVLDQGLDEYLRLDSATAMACASDAADPAIPAAGARVRVPVLLVACKQDQVMPVDNVEYTANVIPNCQVRWIDQCGHIPMIEKHAEYLGIIREFLVLQD